MSVVDRTGPAPEARSANFVMLLLACAAAPIFWAGQVMASYAVSAYVCYPGDAPRSSAPSFLLNLLIAFDVVALAAALLGGAISLFAWREARRQQPSAQPLDLSAGRTRLLALWGLMSSLWFFFAILFNVIASLWVPLCAN